MSDAIKKFVEQAKSIPLAIYHLVLINIVLLIGLVFREFTVLYLAGIFLFIIMLISALGCATALWANPSELISENVRVRIN